MYRPALALILTVIAGVFSAAKVRARTGEGM